MATRRIVIVGGGVGGIQLATALGRRYRRRQRGEPIASITLIDREPAHVWKPMLHTIAAGTSEVSQQQTSYVAQAHQAGFIYRPGEVCGLDRGSAEVVVSALRARDGRTLIPERRVPYDLLVIAVGSRADDFGIPGVAEHCFNIDSREQAIGFSREVRIQLLQCLTQKAELPILIVGGGATGVELAAQLVQLTKLGEAYGAKNLADLVSINLIERSERLLAAFPKDISAETQKKLESLGVRVTMQAKVLRVTAEGLELADMPPVVGKLKVWAAGVRGPEFLSQLDGLETSKRNQLMVLPSLQSINDPKVFAIGDCARVRFENGDEGLPTTAQVASQQASHLIRHLPAAIEAGRPIPAFEYHDLGSIVSLGDYAAFGTLGKFGFFAGRSFRGRLAQLTHAMLYRSHQAKLYGTWRGSLLWLVDILNKRVWPSDGGAGAHKP